MRFLNSIILNLLIVIIPILIFLYIWIWKRYDRILKDLGKKELIQKLVTVNLKNKKRKLLIVFISIIFILLALARPQFGSSAIEAKCRGVDILVAIDTSKSMLVEDIKPNRLYKSKLEIEKLIHALDQDRIGLIGFAGTAFMLCPLTLDKDTARMFLSILDDNLISVPGTSISTAIDLALKSFDSKEKKYKVLILITDGEDHEGAVLESAKKAKEQGVLVFTIGIGKAIGEPIPLKDKHGRGLGFKKDQSGNVVISKLNQGLLNKIAKETSGQYYRVSSGEWGLTKIYEQIKSLEKKELETKMITIYEEKYQYFLFFALLLLFLEFFIPERKKIKTTALGVLLFMFFSAPIYADSYKDSYSAYKKKNYDKALIEYQKILEKDRDNQEILYNIGNTCYRKNDYERAEKCYKRINTLKNKELKFRALYNLGNTFYKANKIDQALQAYKQALSVNSEDKDAKFNIEFINKIKKNEESSKDKKQGQQKPQSQPKKKQQSKEEKEEQQEQQEQEQQMPQKEQQQDQEPNKEEQKEQEEKEEKEEKEEQEQQQQQDKENQSNQEKKDSDKQESDSESDSKKDEKKDQEISKQEAEAVLAQIDEDQNALKNLRVHKRAKQQQIIKDW